MTPNSANPSNEGRISPGTVEASLQRIRGSLTDDEIGEIRRQLDDVVHEQIGQMRALLTTMTVSEQEERRRIAHVLHEDLQQTLYGIQMRVGSVRDAVSNDEKLGRWATQAHEWLSDAIRVTRQLSMDFSPPVLHDDGVVEALDWLAAHMEQTHGLHVEIEPEHPPDVDLGILEQVLYHVVRELLVNVVKHARTNRARVSMELEGDAVILRVEDFGQGFDLSAESGAVRLGLLGARERLALFGGSLEVASKPGDGTQIVLRVPRTSGRA